MYLSNCTQQGLDTTHIGLTAVGEIKQNRGMIASYLMEKNIIDFEHIKEIEELNVKPQIRKKKKKTRKKETWAYFLNVSKL